MEFTPSYFEGEEREGFFVQPMMKKAWAAQLEVLEVIRSICKRHGIRFFAEWGTLLGAVRHKGFIPWDDDCDLGMLREDYEKFWKCVRQEVPKGYVVYDINSPTFHELMIRVVNTDHINMEPEFLEKYHGCPYGVGIDIFCLDHIPRRREEEQIQLTLLTAANTLGREWDSDEISMEEKLENVRQIAEITGVNLRDDIPIPAQLLWLSDKISGMYCGQPSDEVTMMHMLAEFPHWRVPNSCYEQLIEMPFENTTIPVPADYDRLLRLRYGEEYMVPVKVWGTHDYPFFKKQIELLRDYFARQGMKMPECFDMECSV